MNRIGQFKWIIAPVLSAFVLASCSNKRQTEIGGSGTLEAAEIVLSVKTGGTVVETGAREGDTVQAGQMIVRIETEKVDLQKRLLLAGLNELRLNLKNAERAADLARETFDAADKKFNRIQSLREGNSVSQQQFEDAETAFKAALTQNENAATSLQALRAKEEQVRLQIELVDSQLRDAVVAAPIRGTVLETYVDRGEVARPGGPVASLADLSQMWIKIYIKETELGEIRLGDKAALSIDSQPKRTFEGEVSWISSKAEFTPKMVQTQDARSDLVYAVKITVPNPDGVLKIGMPADVAVKRDQAVEDTKR